MLKINLLPIRQLKKRSQARKELLGVLLLFLCTVALLVVAGFSQVQKIDQMNKEIALLNEEKTKYTPVLKRIAKLKKDTAEFNRRSKIIDKLKEDSSLTVRILDEVANKLDNERVWLSSLQQQSSSLRLSGIALDNQTVAGFMDDLKASQFVQNVNLTNSSLKVISGRNLKSFQLVSTVSQPKLPKAVPAETK